MQNIKNDIIINENNAIINKNVCLLKETDTLADDIEKQLKDIDFSSLDNLLNDVDKEAKDNIVGNSFLDLVKKFLNAENNDLYSSFFGYISSIIFSNIFNILPYFATIVAIAVIYSIIGQFSTTKNKSNFNLIGIVCFSAIASIVLKIVINLLTEVSGTIGTIESQMEIIFPIILTMMTAIGNVVAVSSFQPALAVLSVGITKLFTIVLIPIFVVSVVFNVIGNISQNIKLDKFSKFFSSLFNWIIGIFFTIFVAFLTIQGLTVSSLDAISLKTAKFAIKSYVPVLGSYLSDGVGLIIASSVLIKNAVGVSGLTILGITILAPIIKIGIIILLFKLVSAILETICDEKLPNFLFAVSKSLNMLNICLLAIGVMYLICLSLLMCCSNVF